MHLLLILATLLTAAEPAASRDAKLGGTVDALWAALSHGPDAGADREKLALLFHPDARVYGVRGEALTIRSGSEFIDRVAVPDEKGFYEREVFRQIDASGAFAQVLSTVESHETQTSTKPLVTGINGIHLYWNGNDWQIVALYYALENERDRIPDRYRRQ